MSEKHRVGMEAKVKHTIDGTALEDACCIVDEAVEQIVEECCVAIDKHSDEAILAKPHPTMRGVFTPKVWDSFSDEEQTAAWDKYNADLKVYHAAYLNVYGVECRDCTC